MKYKGKLLICLLAVLLGSLPARAQYDKDVFMFRGRTALAEGHLAEAVSHFNVLAQLDTTDYWTFFYRGIAKYNLGDIRGARTDFNTFRSGPARPACISPGASRTSSASSSSPPSRISTNTSARSLRTRRPT